MRNGWLAIGAASAFFAVAAGAFGAHALRDRLSLEEKAIFEIAVRYQMYHALGIVVAGLWLESRHSRLVSVAAAAFAAGTALFCGSLYTLTFTGQRWLGAITPLGGLAFLLGWSLLTAAALRRSTSVRRG